MGSKTGGQPRLEAWVGADRGNRAGPDWATLGWARAGARAGQQGATLQPPPYGTR